MASLFGEMNAFVICKNLKSSLKLFSNEIIYFKTPEILNNRAKDIKFWIVTYIPKVK